MVFRRQLRCSFCRRDEAHVAKLVAGPRVYICDACVEIAARIMTDAGDGPHATVSRPTFAQRLRRRFAGTRGLDATHRHLVIHTR
jgi:ATP-dependent protease Clp ATPase subunit